MMDLFANYGTAKAPQRLKPREEKPLSQLDLKLREKQRLSASYRKWRTANARDVMRSEPRLAAFVKWLRRCASGREIVTGIKESWLPQAALDVRIYALRLVSARCDKINVSQGFDVLDDPMPPATSTYFEARALLHPGGRG